MRGLTLVELLVALAVSLVVCALAAVALAEAAAALAWQPAAGELSARAHAAMQSLAADIAAAGAGPVARLNPVDPGADVPATHRLAAWLPPVLPRLVDLGGGDAEAVAASDRLTLLAIPDGAPQAVVERSPPQWVWRPGPTCPAADGCGFTAGRAVLRLQRELGFRLAEVRGADPSGLVLTDATAEADAALVAAVGLTSYRFDRARGELQRARAEGRFLALVDHVAAFDVELWGHAAPPRGPRWTTGGDCVTAADGSPRLAAIAVPPPAPRLVRLEPGRLTDGPWCGTAPFRFDADLLRVRRVRVRLRLEAEHDAQRGRDPRRFAAPGSAPGPAHEVADLDLAADVEPAAIEAPP